MQHYRTELERGSTHTPSSTIGKTNNELKLQKHNDAWSCFIGIQLK